MAKIIFCAFLVISKVLPAATHAPTQDYEHAAMGSDDQCYGSSPCALSALQLRAGKKVLRGDPPDVAGEYAQCGGQGFSGPTNCSAGFVCMTDNEFWSMCKPEGGPAPAPQATAPQGLPDDDDDDKADDWHIVVGEPSEVAPMELPKRAPIVAKSVGPINPIFIRGNFLYDAITEKRFFSKGVAYNPRNIKYSQVSEGPKSDECRSGHPKAAELDYAADVATDELEDQWGPALEAIANMGANTIRLYNINPDNSHTKFMKKAADLGIYVIIPLTRKDWGYLPAFASPDCYTLNVTEYGNVGVNLLTSAKLIVKEFSNYPNTLLFAVANEMTVNDKNGYSAFPCVKALTRDIHRYQADCRETMRRIPLIYADMDMGPPDRVQIGKYLSCELESPDDAVDAYGLNVYSWCDETYPDETGKDNFQYSPYSDILKDFKTFNKPLLFTEFGCNLGTFQTKCPYKGGRTWPDVAHLVKDMGEVVSGAIAFEFSMEQNQYGLALTPGFLKGQDELYLLDNYYALQKQFQRYDISSKWDGINVSNCSAKPTDVAKLTDVKAVPVCPSAPQARELQKKHNVDNISNWDVLPPAPRAPLSDVNNQTECPVNFDVTSVDKKEQCCHMDCLSLCETLSGHWVHRPHWGHYGHRPHW